MQLPIPPELEWRFSQIAVELGCGWAITEYMNVINYLCPNLRKKTMKIKAFQCGLQYRWPTVSGLNQDCSLKHGLGPVWSTCALFQIWQWANASWQNILRFLWHLLDVSFVYMFVGNRLSMAFDILTWTLNEFSELYDILSVLCYVSICDRRNLWLKVTGVAICDGKCHNLWQRQNMQFDGIYSINFDKYVIISSYIY